MELDRRRFLTRLALAAGAGALVPLMGRVRPAGTGSTVNLESGRPALGTGVRLAVRGHDHATATRGLERAFAAIQDVDARMSIHRPDSEISRVNAAAGRSAVSVSPDVIDVARRACEVSLASGGVYDPTVLEMMKLFGFYNSGRSELPSSRELAAVMAPMGARNVLIDAARGTLGLSKAGAGLDFGSIGKGWAVDRAVTALRGEGIRSALVDVGGNVYGLGTPDESAEGWSVGVFHPKTGEASKVFVLRDCAVATSGNYYQFRVLNHVRVGHHLNCRKGRPEDGHLSASVLARTGMDSDVLGNVAFLLGPDKFRGWPGALDAHFIG